MSNRLKIRYDKHSDVLYLVLHTAAATRGIENHQGIVWRYGPDSRLIGATIMDYHERWAYKTHNLVDQLAPRFNLASLEIEQALNAYWSNSHEHETVVIRRI